MSGKFIFSLKVLPSYDIMVESNINIIQINAFQIPFCLG